MIKNLNLRRWNPEAGILKVLRKLEPRFVQQIFFLLSYFFIFFNVQS